jgi:AcrR family transcriptional regulator
VVDWLNITDISTMVTVEISTEPPAGYHQLMTHPSAADAASSMRHANAAGHRDETRQRVVKAAADLLAREGREAVTTRAVAAAAGLQPPAIYRLFGDKDGLLDAVVEHAYATFLARKRTATSPSDPVADLRAGWDLAVEFGISNPELYALMYGEPKRGTTSAAFLAGMQILTGRINRLAVNGLLRLSEGMAATVIHATARGAVLTWLSLPEDQRDPALLDAMRESMVTAVTTQAPAIDDPGPAAAANALRASLPETTALSPAERSLLTDWLDRLIDRAPTKDVSSTRRAR